LKFAYITHSEDRRSQQQKFVPGSFVELTLRMAARYHIVTLSGI